jgi:hypothetical protein
MWGALQAGVYLALGVASYAWYYAPLVPGGAVIAALGAETVARRLGRPRLATLVAGPLVVAQLAVLLEARAATPEPRALAYEAVGRWIAANSRPDERVAVMEVGIMGYYARRPMVDLLGLLRPESIDALRRQDGLWTIADSRADLVVLTAVNPLWFQDAPPGHWLHDRYAPVFVHHQEGFWGSPITVRRLTVPWPEKWLERPAPGRFGEGLAVTRVEVDRIEAAPGDPVTVRLTWRGLASASRDYAAFVHVVSDEPRVVAQHDTPIATSRWPIDRRVTTYHPTRLPADLAPGAYGVEAGVYLPESPLARLSPLDAPHPRQVAVVAELTVRAR